MLNELNDDDDDNELDNLLQYIDQMQSLIDPGERDFLLKKNIFELTYPNRCC
jgi:hypothetical protein